MSCSIVRKRSAELGRCLRRGGGGQRGEDTVVDLGVEDGEGQAVGVKPPADPGGRALCELEQRGGGVITEGGGGLDAGAGTGRIGGSPGASCGRSAGGSTCSRRGGPDSRRDFGAVGWRC